MMTLRAPNSVHVRSLFDAPSRFVSAIHVMKPKSLPRLLLVDDDPVFGRVMQRAAACVGAALTYVGSLAELGDDSPEDFDVAIVDYDLGTTTGLALTRRLDRQARMPIVLISGTVRSPDRRWSESIHEFLLKASGPFAIIDAAFEAHEITRIHHGMRLASRNR